MYKFSKKFEIHYEIKTTLTTEQIWPDGDAPIDATAEDVVTRIENLGGMKKIIDEWELDSGHPDEKVYFNVSFLEFNLPKK